MERIESTRGYNYIFEGFIFRSNSVRRGTRYLVCEESTCNSRATIPEFGEPTMTPHNHAPSPGQVEYKHLRNELRQLATADRHRTAQELFDYVSAR